MSDVIRTIRTKGDFDDVLREEAKKFGISINSLLNQIIERYVLSYRFIDVFPCLVIPSEMIRGLLNGLSEDQLKEEGYAAGSFIPKHSLFLKGMTPNLEDVILCMENMLSQHSHWYQFQCQTINGRMTMLLRHRLGEKWSIYLNSYYTALFKKLLDITIKSEIGENSLAIILPKSVKINNGNNKLDQVQNHK